MFKRLKAFFYSKLDKIIPDEITENQAIMFFRFVADLSMLVIVGSLLVGISIYAYTEKYVVIIPLFFTMFSFLGIGYACAIAENNIRDHQKQKQQNPSTLSDVIRDYLERQKK